MPALHGVDQDRLALRQGQRGRRPAHRAQTGQVFLVSKIFISSRGNGRNALYQGQSVSGPQRATLQAAEDHIAQALKDTTSGELAFSIDHDKVVANGRIVGLVSALPNSVVGVFMGGLALGGWWGGRQADRRSGGNLLALYGLLEGGVAISALLPIAFYMNWKMAILIVALLIVFAAVNAIVINKTWRAQGTVENYNSELAARAGDRFGAALTAWNFNGVPSPADLAVGVPMADVVIRPSLVTSICKPGFTTIAPRSPSISTSVSGKTSGSVRLS